MSQLEAWAKLMNTFQNVYFHISIKINSERYSAVATTIFKCCPECSPAVTACFTDGCLETLAN